MTRFDNMNGPYFKRGTSFCFRMPLLDCDQEKRSCDHENSSWLVAVVEVRASTIITERENYDLN